MKSIEITKEGYDGIPKDKDALSKADFEAWAETKDAELIPQAISVVKGFYHDAKVSTVTPTEATATVTAGETVNVSVTLAPDYVEDKTVTWTSSATGKATVAADANDSRKAVVTGVSAGSATITATVDSQSGTIAVTVSAAE